MMFNFRCLSYTRTKRAECWGQRKKLQFIVGLLSVCVCVCMAFVALDFNDSVYFVRHHQPAFPMQAFSFSYLNDNDCVQQCWSWH